MSPHDTHVREFDGLVGLASVVPADAWERRVHARCRAAFDQPQRGRVAPRLLDSAIVIAIGLYLAAVVTDAVRLVGAS